MARPRTPFTTVKTEGALLPADFLARVAEGGKDVPGLAPESYHLPPREKLSEAITRSWNRLLGFWAAFQTSTANLNQDDPATGLTRDKWLLPLFQELGYGRLPVGKGFEIEGKSYPISHLWQHTPIHLLGRNVDLDRAIKGVAGAARRSPHGLMQEFLNRHEGHLWGFVSNGLKLRLLRDNKSLTRQAYVEFDLAGMMDGQVYSDFALLWLVCHQSRVEAERAEQCFLEKWADAARDRGTRALDQLRDGVTDAIKALGRGFPGPACGSLRRTNPERRAYRPEVADQFGRRFGSYRPKTMSSPARTSSSSAQDTLPGALDLSRRPKAEARFRRPLPSP